MSTIGTILLFFLSCAIIASGLTPTSYLTIVDKERIKSVLDSSYNKGPKDVKVVSSVVFGYFLLERKFNHEKEACDLFKHVFTNSEDIDDLYHSSFGASNLGSGVCVLDVATPKKVLFELDKVDSMERLYKVVMTRQYLGLENVAGGIGSVMDIVLKREGGASNQAYSYSIASLIFSEKKDLKKYWVDIEDTLQQADEADGVHLYYEGGLYTTARIVHSILELSDKYGEAPPVPREKLVKLANFLLSRRQTQSVTALVQVTLALKSLARNQFAVPMVVSALENAVVDKHDAKLMMSVTNVWGDPITGEGVAIVAETVKNMHTAVTALTRLAAIRGPLPGLYELDLVSGNLDKGFYNVKLEIKANETRFSGVTSANLVAKVTTDVVVDQVELSIKERDQMTGALNYKLKMGSLLAEKLSINWHHRLEMKFTVMDGQQVFKPHQVFIKLTHSNSRQEIIFVAEADKADSYKFVLDLEKSSKDFDNLSGDYEMELIVGDAVMRRPVQWIFASIKLEMPGVPSGESVGDSRRSVAGMKKTGVVNPRVGQGPTVAKEKIQHVFRPAEKRAGDLIAIVFTVLCTVPPLIMMLLMWSMIGVNVSHLELSLASVTFHMGLTLIFALYYCYWTYLDMFTTLRCLLPLGALTAFAGNRVLRQVASRRHKL